MTLMSLLEKDILEGFNRFNRGIHETLNRPLDAFWIDDKIRLEVDLGGFSKDKVHVELVHNILIIDAERDSISDVMEKKKKDIDIIYEHRPLSIRSHIPLPFLPEFDDDKKKQKPKISKESITLENGVLSLDIINLPKRERHKPQ